MLVPTPHSPVAERRTSTPTLTSGQGIFLIYCIIYLALISQISNTAASLADDEFLEILINNLRNDIISYQSHVLNLQKKSKKKLLEKLSSEKNKRPLNLALISELEGKLLIIEENELSFITDKIQRLRILTLSGLLPSF
jgi:hypothetical protein